MCIWVVRNLLVHHFLLTSWVKGFQGSFFVRYFFKELGTSLYNAWEVIYMCEFGGGKKSICSFSMHEK